MHLIPEEEKYQTISYRLISFEIQRIFSFTGLMSRLMGEWLLLSLQSQYAATGPNRESDDHFEQQAKP